MENGRENLEKLDYQSRSSNIQLERLIERGNRRNEGYEINKEMILLGYVFYLLHIIQCVIVYTLYNTMCKTSTVNKNQQKPG